jgi:hypothetical protein
MTPASQAKKIPKEIKGMISIVASLTGIGAPS